MRINALYNDLKGIVKEVNSLGRFTNHIFERENKNTRDKIKIEKSLEYADYIISNFLECLQKNLTYRYIYEPDAFILENCSKFLGIETVKYRQRKVLGIDYNEPYITNEAERLFHSIELYFYANFKDEIGPFFKKSVFLKNDDTIRKESYVRYFNSKRAYDNLQQNISERLLPFANAFSENKVARACVLNEDSVVTGFGQIDEKAFLDALKTGRIKVGHVEVKNTDVHVNVACPIDRIVVYPIINVENI